MIRLALALAALSLAACASAAPTRPVGAEARPEAEAEVLETVERFLAAIMTHDRETWRELLLEGSNATIQLETPEGDWRFVSLDYDRLAAFQDGPQTREESEPIWATTVLVRGNMAVAWAPYEFLRDGERMHCGVDVFILQKVEGAWKIGSSAWTQEKTRCADLDAAR